LLSKCLNFRLEGIALVPTMRKPFDVLAEGIDSAKHRSDRTPVELFALAVPELYHALHDHDFAARA